MDSDAPIGLLDAPPASISRRDAQVGLVPHYARSQAEEVTRLLGEGVKSGTVSSQGVRAALNKEVNGESLSPDAVADLLRYLAHHGSSDSVRWRAAQSALELHRVLSEEATLYGKLIGADAGQGDTHNHLHLHTTDPEIARMLAVAARDPEVMAALDRAMERQAAEASKAGGE